MSLPELPKSTSLDNSCSVIHDNTLYSFSPDGFLSLRLEDGAEWKKLDTGVKVSGATCVGTTPTDASQTALFIVGGKADDDSYTGLQKFTFSTGKWATITPSDLVTKNRQWHGSTYLQADDSIVVYAGSQDGSRGLSTQTFTIKASEPYDAHGYQSSAPPGIEPTLLRWSDADVALIGGDQSKVWWFNPAAGWRESPANLAQPIALDSAAIEIMLIAGDDGSKSLLSFDMAQSPNKVSRVVLQDESGNLIPNSTPVSARDLDASSSSDKRDLNLSNWPKYNATLAPTATRQNYAFAQGSDGMVVFSGGNNDHPLAIFNAADNSWVNATALFAESDQKILAESTTSALPTSTSSTVLSSSTFATSTMQTTAASTTTEAVLPPAAAGDKNDDDSGISSNAILGITLGTIGGFLAILILILLLLRRRKRRQIHSEIGHSRRASGVPSEEKDTAGFTKSTFSPASPGHFRGHHPTMSQESYSSVAILMGRVGNQKSNLTRKASNDTARSSVSSMHKQFKSTISKPIPQMNNHPALQAQDDRGVAFAPNVAEPRRRNGPMEANDGTRRSSGWNKYWSGGSALQILGFGASKRNTTGSEQSSRYSQATNNPHTNNPRATQDSATVPPLNFEGRPEVNSVNSGSPVVAQYNSKVPLTEGMAGKIERPVSAVSSGYSSGIPESVNDLWDPVHGEKPWGSDRAPNGAYSSNVQYGTPLAPSSSGARGPTTLGVSKQPQLAMASTSSDMSWLNLGEQSRNKHGA